MSFGDHCKEEIRLVLLRSLNEFPSYRGNTSTLHRRLESLALSVSRDQVKTELYWLAEQGLIKIEEDLDSIMMVKLTTRGQDVAEGRIRTHGVLRPSA